MSSGWSLLYQKLMAMGLALLAFRIAAEVDLRKLGSEHLLQQFCIVLQRILKVQRQDSQRIFVSFGKEGKRLVWNQAKGR